MKDDKPAQPAAQDVALIHGRTEDGAGLRVLRKREDRLEVGEVRPLQEGKPIQGEVVSLRPRPECPLLCDVKVELEAPERPALPEARRSGGPAQVATDDYRRNWELIFRQATEEPELSN